MSARFGKSDDLYLILANYIIGGREVDLTVMKKDSIIVIELKECNEQFTAYENGEWKTEKGGKIGHNGMNPYRQIMEYRKRWVDMLNENKNNFNCLKNLKKNHRSFWYVKGFVVISPYMHANTKDKISAENWWFRLCGLNELDEKIELETKKTLNFSKEELRFIAKNILMTNNPKIICPENTHTIAEQIRKGADNLIEIIETTKKKLTQYENDVNFIKNSIAEKDSIILEIQNENKELCKMIEERNNMILQMENEKKQLLAGYNQEIEKVRGEAGKSNEEIFHRMVEHIVYNYLNHIDNKKAVNLAMFSRKLGMKEEYAMKIINKIVATQKKKS
ncbi:MAG: nuclease-related domain-containing protein [Candidatus Electronema sp. V4]|uniref:nuclease-related domain-containing protein n=1 Tax=Candidatus Electronema sp. V4 TaxID=3454756 RepID=UPI0040559808